MTSPKSETAWDVVSAIARRIVVWAVLMWLAHLTGVLVEANRKIAVLEAAVQQLKPKVTP